MAKMNVFILIFNIHCLGDAFIIKCLDAPTNKRKEFSFHGKGFFLCPPSKNPSSINKSGYHCNGSQISVHYKQKCNDDSKGLAIDQTLF